MLPTLRSSYLMRFIRWGQLQSALGNEGAVIYR
jgi:hypothetical protein